MKISFVDIPPDKIPMTLWDFISKTGAPDYPSTVDPIKYVIIEYITYLYNFSKLFWYTYNSSNFLTKTISL